MTNRIQSVAFLVGLTMLGYGLWLIHPAAMYVGIGGLMLTGVVATRNTRGTNA